MIKGYYFTCKISRIVGVFLSIFKAHTTTIGLFRTNLTINLWILNNTKGREV